MSFGDMSIWRNELFRNIRWRNVNWRDVILPITPYPNKKWGTRLLLDIRSYLISKIINPKKVKYPEYFLNINNVENEKRYFRNIASNYAIDKYNNLYIKYYKNNKKDKLD